MGVLKKIIGLVAIVALNYVTFGAGGLVASGALGSGFLGTLIGAVIVAAGVTLIQIALGGQGRAPDQDAGKVNVRISEPSRWLNAGLCRQGGGVLFAEFDSGGNFWYLVVHSDSIMTGNPVYYMDDQLVTIGGDGYIVQPDFRLLANKEKDPATTNGEGDGYVKIWTRTYSETDPEPPRVADFDAAFPQWTADHILAGTTFSVVKMNALEIEHRFKIYRGRGPIGMGEYAVSIVADFSNMYDPRDVTQTLGDRSTYKPSRNAALVWAWFRTHPYGRNKPESAINWDRIAEQADICDQTVTGVYGDQPRYECAISVVDSKRRFTAETEIMLSMDGQIVFDEDGKTWVRAGHWYAPTLSFSRNRDIMAMATMEAQDGESETHGVIVRYIDPNANYTAQPSAAWLNPLYYDPATTPKFLTVDVLSCHNHNQAMRLAKGIGMRSQPLHKIGPTLNVRGLQARQERIVSINYDNTFSGDYEIAVPVELDGSGIFTGFGAVPIDANRWTLLPGEESAAPVVDGSATVDTFPAITGESVAYTGGVVVISFPTLPRSDAVYLAEIIPTADITGGSSDPWVPMTINVDSAVSGFVMEGTGYTVRYRYTVGSGRGPAWEYDTITPGITISPVTDLSATGAVGSVLVAWRNSVDARAINVRVWRNTTTTFGTATDISGLISMNGLGAMQDYTDTVAAGTRYYWLVAYDASANASNETGPVTGIAT